MTRCGEFEGNPDGGHRTNSRRGIYLNLPPKKLSPFSYALETELFRFSYVAGVEPSAIVLNLQLYPAAGTANRDHSSSCLGMTNHIGQQLLRHSIDRAFDFYPATGPESDSIRHNVTAKAGPLLDVGCKALQSRHKPQFLQQRRLESRDHSSEGRKEAIDHAERTRRFLAQCRDWAAAILDECPSHIRQIELQPGQHLPEFIVQLP